MTGIEILESSIFYLFALIIIGFALLTIFARKIIYAILCAIVVFLTLAGVFFLLGADYNAVVQIVLYGIAVPILLVFAVMFTTKNEETHAVTSSPRLVLAFFSAILLFMALVYLVATSIRLNPDFNVTAVEINKYQMFSSLAHGILVNYVFAFEILSILLLVAVVGVATLNLLRGQADD